VSAGRPVALVTGGSRGIGRSTALELARHGFDVAITSSRSQDAADAVARELEALGVGTMVVQADVADEPAVVRTVDGIRRRFGRLDALVNNAGTTTETPQPDIEGLSMADWDRVFAVNVRGLFQVTRACLPLLREAPNGAIVNLASVAGLRPSTQPFPYAASKAAVVNLTGTLARALGPRIRVNAVAPGWMVGDWMQRTLGDDYDRLMERRAKMTPLGRCVTPDDVAVTIVDLIVGNHFVTGEVIVIDGGYAATT
jgi:3-oxoacyl-[acyl-carrier protein] reductase